jgi:hypothetical protein
MNRAGWAASQGAVAGYRFGGDSPVSNTPLDSLFQMRYYHGAMIAMIDKIYTVQDIAKARGYSIRRANKLCSELDIGRIVGNTRILDHKEFKAVVNLPDRRTAKFKKSKKAS